MSSRRSQETLNALAQASSGCPRLTVWLNRHGVPGGVPGLFVGNGQTLAVVTNSVVQAVALGDFGLDGKLHLLAAGTRGFRKVFQNDGTGLFTDTGFTIGSSDRPVTAVAVGDLDGNGSPDLLLVHQGAPAEVWLNQTASSPLPVPLATRLELERQGDAWTLRWQSEPGLSYRLQRSTGALNAFVPAGAWRQGEGGYLSEPPKASREGHSFYRLEIMKED